MKTSESIKNLSSALLKAQKNIGAATKGAANPFFKSKYADLGSVMEACKGALNDEGITVLQPVQSSTDGDFVETLLLHESGEFISSTMKLMLSKQDMQAYGSAVSYARRYSLQSLMFIPAEDDDGEKSVQRPNQHKEVHQKPSKLQSIILNSIDPSTISIDSIKINTGQEITSDLQLTQSIEFGKKLEEVKPTASRTTFRGRTPNVTLPKSEVASSVTQQAAKTSLNF